MQGRSLDPQSEEGNKCRSDADRARSVQSLGVIARGEVASCRRGVVCAMLDIAGGAARVVCVAAREGCMVLSGRFARSSGMSLIDAWWTAPIPAATARSALIGEVGV
jgi:hypothetical protein